MNSYWDEKQKDYHKNKAAELKQTAKYIKSKSDDTLVHTINDAWRYLNELSDTRMTDSEHEKRKAIMTRLKSLTGFEGKK